MGRSSSKLQGILQQAHQAARQEHLGSALMLYRKAHGLDKNNADIMFRLGHVLVMAGYHDEAIDVLKKAVKRRSHHIDTLVLLSQAQLSVGDFEGMHGTLDKALVRDPSHGSALMAKVNAYLDSGMIEEAGAVLDAVGEIENPHVLVRISRARYAKDTKEYGRAIDEFESLIGDGEVGEDYKRTARFELGSVFDKMGEYDRAFGCFELANAGHIAGKTAHVPSLQSAWSAEVLASVPKSTVFDERAVMIAGMPRSGTTLIERVISAHGLGGSVGECPLMVQMLSRTLVGNLDQERIDSYAREYGGMLDERVGAGVERVIDKHMGSEKDLGLVSRVLPGGG